MSGLTVDDLLARWAEIGDVIQEPGAGRRPPRRGS